MVDKNYAKIEEGQEAHVTQYGHSLRVKIYEVENERAYFRTINRQAGQPGNGNFNRIECSRYLTVIK